MEIKPLARVVVIENHTMVRHLLTQLLSDDLGLTVAAECTTVADGNEALLREKPDLAITDWMLPDGRGFDLVRTFRLRLPRTRWLFVSTNDHGNTVREAVSLGVHGFVLKRSDLATLRTAITSVLSGEQYYCQESSRILVNKMVEEGNIAPIKLTTREAETLRSFARGESTKAFASRLGVSTKTVQNHLTLLKGKLRVQEPAEIVHYAIKHGYIECP